MQLQVKLRLPQCVVPSTDEYPHTCMLWCTNHAVCMCMPWAMLASGQKRASASIGQTPAGSSILSAPALTTARPSGSIYAFGPLTGHEREGIEVGEGLQANRQAPTAECTVYMTCILMCLSQSAFCFGAARMCICAVSINSSFFFYVAATAWAILWGK